MALSSVWQEALKLQAAQLAAGVKPASVTTTKVSRTPTPAAKPTATATTKPTQTLSPALQAALATQEAQLAAGVKPATVETTKVQTSATSATFPTSQQQLSPTLQAAQATQAAQLAAGVQPANVETTLVVTSAPAQSAVLESFAGADYTVDAPSAQQQASSAALHDLIETRVAEMQAATSIGDLIAAQQAENAAKSSLLNQFLAARRAEMEAAATVLLPWRTPQSAPQSTQQVEPAYVVETPDGYAPPSSWDVDPFTTMMQQLPASYDGEQTIDPTLSDTPPASGSLASMFTPQRVLLLTALGLLTGIWLIGSN